MVNTIRDEAESLYSAGFNIIPLQYGKKLPFGPWTRFHYSRLAKDAITPIFGGNNPINMGVMVGATSRNLFVIDADTPEQKAMIAAEIERRNLSTWERSSARGAQWWYLCEDGEIENVAKDGLDVLGHSKYCLSAPSVVIDESTGEIEEKVWASKPGTLPRSVSIEDMAWMGLRLRNYTRKDKSAIPERANEVLVESDTSRYGGDNSRAEYAACLSLIGAGWNDDDIRAFFNHYQPPHFTETKSEDWEKYCLARAREYSLKNQGAVKRKSSEIGAAADEIRTLIDSIKWRGQSGNTDRAVMITLVDRMRKDNAYVFRAANREIADGANITGLNTVRAALKRLVEVKAITRAAGDANTGASRYSISLEGLQALAPTSSTKIKDAENEKTFKDLPITRSVNSVDTNGSNSEKTGLPGTLQHDAWDRKALGKSAHAILDYLLKNQGQNGLRLAEIIAGSGKVYNTVTSAIAKLMVHGLVSEDGYGKQRRYTAASDITVVDLTMVAWAHGTAGNTDRKKERFRRDQEDYLTGEVIVQIDRVMAYKRSKG